MWWFRALLLASLGAASAALGQEVSEVRFGAGDYGTTVEGRLTGPAYRDYRLDARSGQELFAELDVTGSDGTGTVYFNVLPPGSDGVAVYNGSMDGKTARLDLPEGGTYTIRVYQMGNDRDAGATSRFTLDLSIQ